MDTTAGYKSQREATDAAKISDLADLHRAFAIVLMATGRYDFVGPDDRPLTPLADGGAMAAGRIVARWRWSSKDRRWHRGQVDTIAAR